MSFFDKLRTGVSEAGSKAKVIVEQNKLKLVNVSKQAQIDKLHKEIGIKFSDFHFNGQPIELEAFEIELNQISVLKLEMEQNEHEIAMLSEEKSCKRCGKDNNIMAKSCTNCQAQFEIIDITPNTVVIEAAKIENQAKE